MKALVWEAPRTMNIRQEPEPEVEPGEVLLQVAYAGICGSELGGYLGHNALRVPPLVMGHEFSGEVVRLGARAQEINPALAEGQRVTVNPLQFCGACAYCSRGLNQLCNSRKLIGAHRPGAFAEGVAVPAELVVPLPVGMTAQTGALAEPAGVALRIGELAGQVEGETVLVIGAGPIGLLALQAVQARGAPAVFIADISPERLAMGEALGGRPIDPRQDSVVEVVREATGGDGVPVSVDAVGTAETRTNCVAATRSTGTVILSGLHEETSAMPAADVIRREIVVQGSFAYTPQNFTDAIAWLATGDVTLDPWVVEDALESGGDWFARLVDEPGDVAKVLLKP